MDPGRGDLDPRASTVARPAPGAVIVGLVLALIALVTARAGAGAFTTFVTVLAALGALELATALKRQGAPLKPLLAALGAALFPLGVSRWGELGILAVAGMVFVGFSGALAIRGLRPGTVRQLSALLLAALYVGLAAGFLVLLRRGDEGTAVVEVFLGMILAYRVGFWAGARQLGPPAGGMPSMAGVAAGAVACVVASGFLGLLLTHRPALGAMLGLGLFVSLAATVGTLAGTLFSSRGRSGKPAPRPILGQIEAALLAAPAFFYAFRLLLT
jgi:hypothetical protein